MEHITNFELLDHPIKNVVTTKDLIGFIKPSSSQVQTCWSHSTIGSSIIPDAL